VGVKGLSPLKNQYLSNQQRRKKEFRTSTPQNKTSGTGFWSTDLWNTKEKVDIPFIDPEDERSVRPVHDGAMQKKKRHLAGRWGEKGKGRNHIDPNHGGWKGRKLRKEKASG